MLFCFDFYAQKGAKRFYRGCKSVVIVVDSLIIFIPDGKGAVCVCVCVFHRINVIDRYIDVDR